LCTLLLLKLSHVFKKHRSFPKPCDCSKKLIQNIYAGISAELLILILRKSSLNQSSRWSIKVTKINISVRIRWRSIWLSHSYTCCLPTLGWIPSLWNSESHCIFGGWIHGTIGSSVRLAMLNHTYLSNYTQWRRLWWGWWVYQRRFVYTFSSCQKFYENNTGCQIWMKNYLT